MLLYEYAGKNPIKSNSGLKYKIYIKIGDSTNFEIFAVNNSDRLNFGETGSNLTNATFMKGGLIKFRVKEYEDNNSSYSFDIKNADGYEIAYDNLIGKQ